MKINLKVYVLKGIRNEGHYCTHHYPGYAHSIEGAPMTMMTANKVFRFWMSPEFPSLQVPPDPTAASDHPMMSARQVLRC
jgi:hypothetical protein